MEKRDLTQGSIAGNLLYMAIPAMLGSLAHTLYDIVDMIWIGRISAQAVASVTIYSTIFWLAFVLNNIIGSGSVSLISQSYGSGDQKRTNRVIEQTIAFKFVMALIAGSIVYLLLNPLMVFFSKDPEVVAGAIAYGRVRTLFLPIMFTSISCGTALRCSGDSKRPMYIALLVSVINIVLDPIFIFATIPFVGLPGLNMGIAGAAWATGIANLVSLLLGGWILFTGQSRVHPSLKGLLRLDREIDIKLISIGMPSGISQLLRNLSQILMTKMIAVFGTAALATIGISNRVLNFTFMPLMGLSQGASTIVGQCLGQENLERAEKTAHTTMLLGTVAMAIFACLLIFVPRQIMAIFVSDPEVQQYGVAVLRMFAPALLLTGVRIGCTSVFSGSGYTLPFLISGLVGRWVVQIPTMALAVYVFELSYIYVVGTYLLAEMSEILITIYAYRQGIWRNIRAEKAANLNWKTIKQFFTPVKRVKSEDSAL